MFYERLLWVFINDAPFCLLSFGGNHPCCLTEVGRKKEKPFFVPNIDTQFEKRNFPGKALMQTGVLVNTETVCGGSIL